MQLYLIIFALIIQTGATYKRKPQCHACFDRICYSRSAIFQKYRISGQLAVERSGNIVHYHYTDSKSKDHTEAFDLDDIRFLNVPEIEFSFARAVDQSTRDVYIAGGTGLFKYNSISNKTSRVGLFDKTIWHIQYKNKIYYTEFMKKGLYTYSGKSYTIPELVDYKIDDFVIDKRDDIYFMSNLTMFRLKKGDSKPTVFTNIVYSLSTDINDSVYLVQSVNRGLYKIDYRTGNLTEVGAFANGSPVKAVFDNYNNVIYYDLDTETLFYLTPNYGRCRVKNAGRGKIMKKMVASVLEVANTNWGGQMKTVIIE